MKHKIVLFLTLCAILSVSCAKESQRQSEIRDVEPAHTIPVKEALANLENFLDNFDNVATKSGVQCRARKIKDVSTVYAAELMTKSSADANDCDEILYVVNFEDNGGYAVLAADDRIEADIIAVYDSGNRARVSTSGSLASSRRIYDDFPKTGDGIVVDENGERYLNPNTFSLYDESTGEFLVGDLTLEGGYLPNTDSDLGSSAKKIEPDSPFLEQRIIDYAKNSVRDKITGDLKDKSEDVGNSDNIRTVTFKSAPIFDTLVNPMLPFAKPWHQDSPFNDWFPTVRKWIAFGDKGKASAGCVPLSLAKIMAYCEFPSTVTYGGTSVNWETIKGGGTDFDSQAAALLKKIAEGCHSWYFYGGTFTFPSRAASFLRKMGYGNVEYQDYSTTAVLKSLKASAPVFICSIPQTEKYNHDLMASHGWIIDGYLDRSRDITIRTYKNDKFVEEKRTKTHNIMVHCDFGWKGAYNGYFTSGIFNFADNGNTIFDQGSYKNASKTNYKWHLKTITYDKP